MEARYAISLVLEAHLPFVREFNKEDDLSIANEEIRFFEYITETLLPLLEVLDRLENDHIPFRFALAMSPVLCYMLGDEYFLNKYLAYLDKQIEFGEQEMERTAGQEELYKLTQHYYNQLVDRRIVFAVRYEKNLLKVFDYYRRRGKIEILASCATHAFLPFISNSPESIQAQMEIPISGYRKLFGSCPQGFWLPALGWTPAVETYFRAYNFSYTIVDSHGLLSGNPAPEKGCFYPVKTPKGIFVLGRDFYAMREIEKLANDEVYRSNDRDAGYELPPEMVSQFLSPEGERRRTGYKYHARQTAGLNSDDENAVYDLKAAFNKADEHARLFLEKTIIRLEEASKHMEEAPICVCALNADNFGRCWYEGPHFLETLFRMACGYRDFLFTTPSEYIYKQDIASIQVVSPEFSSSGINGYGETWLDVSNDWIYRHLARSMERMTELAERFPDDTGLKERALNQAAREILLAQSSDWPSMLYTQDSTEYARFHAENALRNFTTIYEALGSNYMSTEWLTTIERRHNIFPNINYRVFRRKK